MIDLCEECGERLEMDEDGQFFCPIQFADVADWRAEFGRQVRRYPASISTPPVMGCMCPQGANKDCQAPLCPRKPLPREF